MKKLMAILAAAVLGALTLAANTGCDVDADLGDERMMVIDNIDVRPDDWMSVRNNGVVEYLYFDIDLPELNGYIFNHGTFQTFLRYGDGDGFQEELPTVRVFSYVDGNGYLIPYTENISCSYGVGGMTLKITRSDFFDGRPTETIYFRTVISY